MGRLIESTRRSQTGLRRAEVYRRAAERGLMTARCWEVGITCLRETPETRICPVCFLGKRPAPVYTGGPLRGPGFAKARAR